MKIDHRTGILKADVSSVIPSSERIEELWVVYSLHSGRGATLLVVTWQREKLNEKRSLIPWRLSVPI